MAATAFIFLACNQPKEPAEKSIANNLVKQVDSFIAASKTLQQAAEKSNANEKQLQQLFLNARLAYKKFEWAAEYFEPATTRFVNGAPVPEIEPSGQTFAPQVYR